MTIPPPRGQSGLGLMMIAVGRKRGFGYFGTDSEAYLNSLAPLVAFTLVTGGVIVFAAGKIHTGLLLALMQLINIIAPPVLAYPICRRWAREANWALYANVLNWVQLLAMIVSSFDALFASLLVALGVSQGAALAVFVAAFMIYSLWLQWFVARGTLRLSRPRTALLLAATLIGTPLLLGAPLIGADLLSHSFPFFSGDLAETLATAPEK